MIAKIIRHLKRILNIKDRYISETSKVRHLVLPYCTGVGCDIGFGGDKIKADSVGIDFAKPYANTGKDRVDIACDVMNEPVPVADHTYDYVYSSHLIEDFSDTRQALIEFTRILKSGGNLILVFPDQKKYETFCINTGQPLNEHHKHAEMGLQYMLNEVSLLPDITYQVLFQSDREIDYNVVLVLKINKNGQY